VRAKLLENKAQLLVNGVLLSWWSMVQLLVNEALLNWTLKHCQVAGRWSIAKLLDNGALTSSWSTERCLAAGQRSVA
jgi:hypothetical protein